MNIEDLLSKKRQDENKEIRYPIKKMKTKDDYAMVFLDDEKIMISVDAYFKYAVASLKGLDEQLYVQLKEDEKRLKAYRGCLRRLAEKDRTVKQIRDYLYRYELDKKECSDIISRLQDYGLLDDEKYCQSRITYYENALLSKKQIRQKLKKEGISDELIDRYLDKEQNEDEKCLQLAQKYLKTTRNKSVNAAKQYIISRLMSAGFAYDSAKYAVESLSIENENELELLRKEYQKTKKKYERKYEDYELSQKIYASLLSKGFCSDDIKKVLEV